MTDYHNYNTPSQGATDWHTPLNENFKNIDTDVEVRDQKSKLSDYTPKSGAKFFAVDTGDVYLGDGSNWNQLDMAGRNPKYRSVASAVVNRRINLKKWRDEFGHGDIGAAWNDAASWLATNYDGGAIHLPAGSYDITTQITWNSSVLGSENPICFYGDGPTATFVGTSVAPAIKIDNLKQNDRPMMGQMSIQTAGGSGTRTFVIGDGGQGNEASFGHLHDIRFVGRNASSGHELIHHNAGYWWTFNHVNLLGGYMRAEGTQGRLNCFNCHFKGGNEDYGVELRSGSARCRFWGGKIKGDNSGDAYVGGDGKHWFYGIDQEGGTSPGLDSQAGTNPNVFWDLSFNGCSPTANDWVWEGKPDNAPPLFMGEDTPTPFSGSGPSKEAGRSHQWVHYLRQPAHEEHLDRAIYSFQNGSPPSFSVSGTGSESVASAPGAPTVLTTGGTSGDTVQLNWNNNEGIQNNKYPMLGWWVQLPSTTDIAVRAGLQTGGSTSGDSRYIIYDDTDTNLTSNTNWIGLWPADDSSGFDIGQAATAGNRTVLVSNALHGEDPESKNDEFNPRVYDISADADNSANAQGFISETLQWEPFIEVEQKTSTAKSVRIYRMGYAQVV